MTLDGTGSSDPDTNDTLTYAWTRTGGPAVTLTNANTATATFTAPASVTEATVFTFRLEVTDADGLSHQDSVKVSGAQMGVMPEITTATGISVAENRTAVTTLTAADSDTETADLTWSIPPGASGGADAGKFTLSAAGVLAFKSAKDFENADDANGDGRYQVTVRVTDEVDLADTADLTVTVTDVNDAPTADAGTDQTGVHPGAVVTLDGTGSSDQDTGDSLTYAWTRTSGPAVTLANADTATATFTVPDDLAAAAAYTFRLTVSDGNLQNEATVRVSALPILTAAFEGLPERHDGSAQFSVVLRFSEEVDISFSAFASGMLTIGGGALDRQRRVTGGSNIAWEIFVTPNGDGNVTITLPADRACDPNLQPCTSDGRSLNAPASVTVKGPYRGPQVAGPATLTAAENQTAVKALTATDAEPPDADLTWSIPAGAAGGVDRDKFTLSTAGVLAFKSAKDFEDPDDANGDGNYQVTVRVAHGALANTADLTVTLTNVNEQPTAEAGDNQFGLQPNAAVTLDGTGSSDPDTDDTLTYAWTRTGGPAVTLTNGNTATATFNVPAGLTQATTYTFKLTVTDSDNLSDEDTLTVKAGPNRPSLPAIRAFRPRRT